jgi:Zn-dependent metalloprotease
MSTRRLRLPRSMALVMVGALALSMASTAAAQGAGPDRIDPSLVRESGDGSRVVFESGTYLAGPSKAAPQRIVLDYVRKHHTDFGLTAPQARGLYVVQELTTAHDGVGRVVLGQKVDDLRIHTAGIVGAVDPDGRLVMVGGRTAAGKTSGEAKLTAGDAIDVAARRSGAEKKALPEAANTKSKGKHTFDNVYASDLPSPQPMSAELVWFIAGDGLRLAWLTDVEVGELNWFGTVVDAETGAVLERDNRYSHSNPQGDVYTQQHPDATGATRTTVDFTGWVTGTMTAGNNTTAYRDRDDSDANDEYQPSDPAAHFQYAFTDAWRDLNGGTDPGPDFDTLAQATIDTALDADIDAAITQLFYYTNDMHDWLLGFGFDEASGNFQLNNPSGNGIAGDLVLAEAQDGWNGGCTNLFLNRCRNNANFGTDGDGTTARMQMYVFAPASADSTPKRPYRDGSMDGDVIAHEYGHGVSNRLVPMTLSGATNQAGSLGEGWSDAISFLRWADDTVGEYVTGNAASGIRSSAYDVHPDTYGDYSTSVGSPHRNGEIWAATMYDIRTRLGINLTTQLILDGMRLTANGPSPTFLDARDGILANDMAANGGANQCALWAAFAGRGMGMSAISNGLHAVPTEDFTSPAACLPTADAGGPYATPEGTYVVLSGAGSAAGTDPSAGSIVLYEWDLDNDSAYDDATGVAPSFPHVGQDGIFTVGLRVTDEWGLTDADTATVTVTNVAPTVTIDPIPEIDEFGTTTISGVITDPGWLDGLIATIDFDDGAGPQPLAAFVENEEPDSTLTFNVTKQYGDDGTFEVTVTGFDDDTSGVGTADAVVHNVDPTAVIDTSGEQVYDGVSAFIVEAGEDLTVPAGSTDPGSDDLTFTWDWNDGSTSTDTSLVNPPALDQPKSPTVQPRDVTLEATHAYGDACLYELTVTVEDDDGGSADDSAAVVITGNADISMGSGWWLNQYRTKPPNDFTTAELECYLAIAGFFSLVFPDGMIRADGAAILHAPAKAPPDVVFDQQALAAWLNFANGAIKLETPVDTDGNGALDSTFGAAMLTAETVRINPASTTAQINAQKDIVERIVLRDE